MNELLSCNINDQEIYYNFKEKENGMKNSIEVEMLRDWIKSEILPYANSRYIDKRNDSGVIKRIAEQELGFSVSNYNLKLILAEFKVKSDFLYKKVPSIYPRYYISKRFYSVKALRAICLR